MDNKQVGHSIEMNLSCLVCVKTVCIYLKHGSLKESRATSPKTVGTCSSHMT